MRLFIYFYGTGDYPQDDEETGQIADSDGTRKYYECLTYTKNTLRLYVSGCQHPLVGNGYYMPDLSIITGYLSELVKDKKINQEILAKLKDAIKVHGLKKQKDLSIDDIYLMGFSRGAVTAYASALALKDLEIPIHVVGLEPVPGNGILVSRPTSDFSLYSNLKAVTNLKSVTNIYGGYSDNVFLFQQAYFKQMRVETPSNTMHSECVLPIPFHCFNRQGLIHHYGAYALSQLNFISQGQYYLSRIKSIYKDAPAFCPKKRTFLTPLSRSTTPIMIDPIYGETLREEVNHYFAIINNYLVQGHHPKSLQLEITSQPMDLALKQNILLIRKNSAHLLKGEDVKILAKWCRFLCQTSPYSQQANVWLNYFSQHYRLILDTLFDKKTKVTITKDDKAEDVFKFQLYRDKLTLFFYDICNSIIEFYRTRRPKLTRYEELRQGINLLKEEIKALYYHHLHPIANMDKGTQYYFFTYTPWSAQYGEQCLQKALEQWDEEAEALKPKEVAPYPIHPHLPYM